MADHTSTRSVANSSDGTSLNPSRALPQTSTTVPDAVKDFQATRWASNLQPYRPTPQFQLGKTSSHFFNVANSASTQIPSSMSLESWHITNRNDREQRTSSLSTSVSGACWCAPESPFAPYVQARAQAPTTQSMKQALQAIASQVQSSPAIVDGEQSVLNTVEKNAPLDGAANVLEQNTKHNLIASEHILAIGHVAAWELEALPRTIIDGSRSSRQISRERRAEDIVAITDEYSSTDGIMFKLFRQYEADLACEDLGFGLTVFEAVAKIIRQELQSGSDVERNPVSMWIAAEWLEALPKVWKYHKHSCLEKLVQLTLTYRRNLVRVTMARKMDKDTLRYLIGQFQQRRIWLVDNAISSIEVILGQWESTDVQLLDAQTYLRPADLRDVPNAIAWLREDLKKLAVTPAGFDCLLG